MPEIKVYSNQVEGLRPSERGIDATLQVARRAGAFYNQAADAVSTVGHQGARGYASAIKEAGDVAVMFAEHQEVSMGAPAFAGLTDALGKKWDDTVKADPNNPMLAQRFREDLLEPEIDKFKSSFNTEGGRKWAESHADALRNHLYTKTAADMGALAANAVSVRMKETINGLSNAAMRDPSSTDFLLKSVDSSVSGMVDSSPNLRGVQAETARTKLSEAAKETIVKAGAIGAIQKAANPEAEAAKWGQRFPQYISGAELKQLEGNARQQIRADRQDAAYNKHVAKEEQQDRSDKTEVGYLQKLYSDKPDERASVSTKAIVNDLNLTRQSKERMIGVVEREMKPETEARVSNKNYVEVLGAIRSGRISDVDPIYKARQEGKLNRADFNQALKDFSEYKSPQGEALSKDRAEFFKRYAPTIDPTMGDISSMQFGHHSALGMQKMYEAEKAARRMEEDARKAGKDPHVVYDPTSEWFFGKPANIIKYRANMQDAVSYQSDIQKADRKAAAPDFAPPATWDYSESRKQYRDPATKKIYGLDGKEVK